MIRHSTKWVKSQLVTLQCKQNKRVRKRLTGRGLIFAGALLSTLVLIRPASIAAETIKSTMKDLIAAAQAERVLATHQSGRFGNPALWRDIQAGIKTKYGIDVQLEGSPAAPRMGQMLSVLIDDYRANRKPARADIFSSGGEQLLRLAQADVLEKIDWKKYMPDLKLEEIAMDGASVAVGVTPYTLVYNTKIVKNPPKSLDDLVDPRYKGMVYVLPYVYGFVQLGVTKGTEPTYALFKKMVCNGNIAGTFRTGRLGRIASGEIPIAAFNGGIVDVQELKAKGAPIEWSDLGGEFRIGTMAYVGVPKNSRSPNLATLATLFLLTPEGQEIFYKHTARDSPFRKGSRLGKLLPKIDYMETPENVQANPEVYQKLYPNMVKLLERGC